MSDMRHHRISERAYDLWLEAGRPHGSDVDHWLRAQREIEAQERAVAGAETLPNAEEAAFDAAEEAADALATATLKQADRRTRTAPPRRRARTAAA